MESDAEIELEESTISSPEWEEGFYSGTGTLENPYMIINASQLHLIWGD